MTVDKVVELIGRKTEKALEKNEDALSWDVENEIKNNLVDRCELGELLKGIELDDIYLYEIFEKVKDKVDNKKKVEIVKLWIELLEELTDIKINIKVSEIK